jgi:clan AA aspartic protease (TIGR02281 family)
MTPKTITLLTALLAAIWLLPPPTVLAQNADFGAGVKLYAAGNFNGAIPKFTAARAAKFQPENALYYQALCHHRLGQVEKAKELYRKIVTEYGTTAAADNARTALGITSPAATAASATAPTAVSSAVALSGGPIEKSVNCEIPFSNNPEGMIVPVQVGGIWVAAIWDTGASPVFFPKSVLEKAGIDLKSMTKAGRAVGIGGEIQTYRLNTTVRVGNQLISMPIMVEDDTASQRNDDRARITYGLLGEDFFGRYVYEVDPSARVIRLLKRTNISTHQPPKTVPRAKGNDMPFRWEDGQIVVTPKINGRECEMIFDTGACSVAFNDKQLTAIGMTRPTNSQKALSYGVGGSRASFQFALDKVQFGPVTRSDVTASIDVFGTQGRPLLGQSFLGGVKYRIDPENSVIHFDE